MKQIHTISHSQFETKDILVMRCVFFNVRAPHAFFLHSNHRDMRFPPLYATVLIIPSIIPNTVNVPPTIAIIDVM